MGCRFAAVFCKRRFSAGFVFTCSSSSALLGAQETARGGGHRQDLEWVALETEICASGSRGNLSEGESGCQDLQEGIPQQAGAGAVQGQWVLFKGTFLVSSKSAGILAPVPASSAMGITSMREVHLWDSPCPAWSQRSEGAVGVSAGAAGRSSTSAAEQPRPALFL